MVWRLFLAEKKYHIGKLFIQSGWTEILGNGNALSNNAATYVPKFVTGLVSIHFTKFRETLDRR